jgi:hypothetical protein
MKACCLALLFLAATPAVAQPVPPPVPMPGPAPAPAPAPPADTLPLPNVIEAPAAPPPDEAPSVDERPPATKLQPPELSPPDTWLPRTQATLRVMNKIDSTVQTLSVPVGGSVNFESLTIRLSGCYVRPPDLPADAAAHLTITDSRPGQPGFDAWMLQNEPALNILEAKVFWFFFPKKNCFLPSSVQ